MQVLGIAPLNMRSMCQRRFTIVEVVTDLTHKVIIRPASSLAQDRESSLVETSVLYPLCYAANYYYYYS